MFDQNAKNVVVISSCSNVQRRPTARTFVQIATAFDENFGQRGIISAGRDEKDRLVELISSFVLDPSLQKHRRNIFVTFPHR